MIRCALLVLLLLLVACKQPSPPPAQPKAPGPEATIEVPPAPVKDLPKKEVQRKTVVVYYRHPLLDGVTPIKRLIYDLSDPTDDVKQVIEQLSMPPDPKDGIAIWPDNIHIREIFFMSEGIVVIDFNDRFVTSLVAGTDTETFLVYSLVNTVLENFPKYKRVQILVDGQVKETFKGHIDIESPLQRSRSLYTIVPEEHLEDEISVENLPPVDGDGSNH